MMHQNILRDIKIKKAYLINLLWKIQFIDTHNLNYEIINLLDRLFY